MQLKTILNRVQKFKRFVYGDVHWENGGEGEVWVVDVRPRGNSRPICKRPGPSYDKLQPRLFEFVPLWGIAVFFLYVMRRVEGKRCGLKVEAVPWADGKQTLTRADMQFLATWAKRMSWKEVAEIFRTSWEKVPIGGVDCRMGAGPPGPIRHYRDRHRRTALAQGASIRLGGLSDRCALPAATMGWQAPHGHDGQ